MDKFSPYLPQTQQFIAVVDVPSASQQIQRFMDNIVYPARNWGVAVGVAGFSLTMIVALLAQLLKEIESR